MNNISNTENVFNKLAGFFCDTNMPHLNSQQIKQSTK